MSALSGITVSPDLAAKFADAVESGSTRFIKISIENESLIHVLSLPIVGLFEQDLARLQDQDVIADNIPAYILAKLDSPSPGWLSIFYVPDSAKMLYASTRPLLLKSLGSTPFTDSIFATSKEDFTAESYAAHLRHVAAPQPLTTREQEMADLRAAENEAANYQGSRARNSPIGTGVGLNWSRDVENAVAELGQGNASGVVIITIDPQTETLLLHAVKDIVMDSLGSSLPPTEPCYALVAFPYENAQNNGREIIFVYSCPSDSPIKFRMLYSSGSTTTYQAAKTLLASLTPSVTLAIRKIETSNPKELDKSYLVTELGFSSGTNGDNTAVPPKAFARPKGPPRRR